MNFSCRKFNISLSPEVEDFLLIWFHKLIYRIGYAVRDSRIDIRDYYQSMALRGDNYDVYNSDAHLDEAMPQDKSWESFNWLRGEDCTFTRRDNKEALELHHMYLFDERVKRNGSRIQSFRVPGDFAKVVRSMQEAMMREVSKRQLGIECCPSSNVRIGYFRRFDEHPILRFYPVEGTESRYPLSVSINTDDLGVFATSLPNEYSLMAVALLKMKDAHGKHRYSSEAVYAWIEKIIRCSHKYRFKQAFRTNNTPAPD